MIGKMISRINKKNIDRFLIIPKYYCDTIKKEDFKLYNLQTNKTSKQLPKLDLFHFILFASEKHNVKYCCKYLCELLIYGLNNLNKNGFIFFYYYSNYNWIVDIISILNMHSDVFIHTIPYNSAFAIIIENISNKEKLIKTLRSIPNTLNINSLLIEPSNTVFNAFSHFKVLNNYYSKSLKDINNSSVDYLVKNICNSTTPIAYNKTLIKEYISSINKYFREKNKVLWISNDAHDYIINKYKTQNNIKVINKLDFETRNKLMNSKIKYDTIWITTDNYLGLCFVLFSKNLHKNGHLIIPSRYKNNNDDLTKLFSPFDNEIKYNVQKVNSFTIFSF